MPEIKVTITRARNIEANIRRGKQINVTIQKVSSTAIPSDPTKVPYTGATSNVDLDTFSLNSKSLHVKGTGGNGHLGLKHQSTGANANANESSLYADSNGDIAWKNDSLYRTTLKTSGNTANRVYTFPNRTGTLADDTDLDGKVNKAGDTINGTFQNSTTKNTKLILTGDATGNNSQGDPVFNSSPRIDLSTSQVSTYQSGDADLGGYSELIRLRAGLPKSKPTVAFYDYNNKPVSWIVSHFQPQDLQRYATFSAFPATGVNDNNTGYFAIDTNTYYYWNGTSYVVITPADERYWYMAIHQHISFETADSTGSSNFTRLGIFYGYDVIPVDLANSHLRVKTGTFKGQDYGAFVLEAGKTYAPTRFDFFPSANVATQLLNRNTGDTNTVFNQNTQSFRVEKLEIGDANNPTATAQIAIGTDNTTTRLIIPKNTIFPNHNLGIGLDPGARFDVRQNLGQVNNTQYTISRISRDASSGFMQFGYIGNGTDLTNFLIRMTNSKGLVIGTSSNPTGFTFANDGTLTLNNAQIKGIATPTATTDVTNKAYVDRAGSTATAGNTVTINALRGYFTTATLTTVANSGTPTITVNSTEIASGDIVRWSFDNYSGVIGANGVPHIIGLSATAGQATATIRNIHNVNALNGTIRVFFEVLKP